jgi:hypothetical protein
MCSPTVFCAKRAKKCRYTEKFSFKRKTFESHVHLAYVMLINKKVPKLTDGQMCVNTALVKYFAVLSGVLGCYVNLEAKHL